MDKNVVCVVCDKQMTPRLGKNVCSATCRVKKHSMNKYFDTVYRNVKQMVKWEDDRVYTAIKKDLKSNGGNVKVFEDWVGKRSK